MRKLKLKGIRHNSRLKAEVVHGTGYGSLVEIYIQYNDTEDAVLPSISSANQCRALSDWLLKAADELEKRGQR